MRKTNWPGTLPGDEWTARSRTRSRDLHVAWTNLLGRLSWEWFVTLTFDPKKVFPVGRQLASRETFWWCGQTGRLLRKPVGWVYAVERGGSGLWHAHVLLIGASVERLTAPTAMWIARNGFVRSVPVSDARGAALYTTKSAAGSSEIVWSDTLARYRDRLAETATVLLYP